MGMGGTSTHSLKLEELPTNRLVCFLPMSHITAQMADFSRMLISDRPTMLTFPPAGAHPDELI